MREKISTWFEVSVSYKKMQEDGTEKKVTEIVVVDAVSFAEAEKRALKEMGSLVRGSVDVKNINPAPYKSVFFDEGDGDKWFKAKLTFLSYDESTGKEFVMLIFRYKRLPYKPSSFCTNWDILEIGIT